MASASKTAQGTWRARWRDADGKSKGRTFPTKRAATDHLVEVEHALRRGTYVDAAAGRITLRAWGEQWLASRVDVRPATKTAMATALRRHAFPVLGDRALSDLRRRDLQALVTIWTQGGDGRNGLAPSSAHGQGAHLSACLAAAVDDGLITSSPWHKIRLPRIEHDNVTPLAPDEVEALTAALPARLALMVPLGVGSGLRPGELLGLGVEHIEGLPRRGHLSIVDGATSTGQLKVRRQLLAPEKGGPLAPLKTGASRRDVPIPGYLVGLIATHLDQYGLGDDGLIFTNRDGGPVARTAASRAWRSAADSVGVTGGPHRMRHSYASALIRAGLSPVAVAKMLGHSSPSTTLSVYAHMWHDDDDRARGAVEAAYGPVAGPGVNTVSASGA